MVLGLKSQLRWSPFLVAAAIRRLRLESKRLKMLRHVAALVREEADGIRLLDPDERKFPLFVAAAAMSLCQTKISTSRYVLRRHNGRSLPTYSHEALRDGMGICGHHVRAFIAIMDILGIPARPVEIYYDYEDGSRDSHIVAEVGWDGRWHMFDVSFGLVACDSGSEAILSYEKIRSGRPLRLRMNAMHPWNLGSTLPIKVRHRYLWSGDVVTDGHGTIHPYIKAKELDRVEFGLDAIPNFIGRTDNGLPDLRQNRPWRVQDFLGGGRPNGRWCELEYEVHLPAGLDVLQLGVRAVVGRNVVFQTPNQSVPATEGIVILRDLQSSVRLRVAGDDPVSYVTLNELIGYRGRSAT